MFCLPVVARLEIVEEPGTGAIGKDDAMPDVERGELEGAIRRLLHRSREIVAGELDVLTVPVMRNVVELTPEGGIRGERRLCHVNILRSWLRPILVAEPDIETLPESRDLARLLLGSYDALCYREVLLQRPDRPDFEHDPEGWIGAEVCRPLGVAYLTQLEDLSADDEALVCRLTDELLTFLESPGVPHRLRLLVGGVDLPGGVVQHDEFRIRDLTTEEIAQVWDFRWSDETDTSPIGRAFGTMFYPTALMTMDFDGTRVDREGGAKETDRFAALLAALSLVGIDVEAGDPRAQMRIHPHWLGGGVRGTPPLAIRTAESKTVTNSALTPESFARAVQLAQQIPPNAWQRPRSHRDVVWHRYIQGMARQQAVDQLFDLVVAMESCLVNDDKELGHKFGLFGAQFVGRDGVDRLEIRDQLMSLYRLRSKLAHGGAFPSQTEIQTGAEIAKALCRRILLKCLETGWPDPTELDKQLLSE